MLVVLMVTPWLPTSWRDSNYCCIRDWVHVKLKGSRSRSANHKPANLNHWISEVWRSPHWMSYTWPTAGMVALDLHILHVAHAHIKNSNTMQQTLCLVSKPAMVLKPSYVSLCQYVQKQIGCFNHRVVTLVAVRQSGLLWHYRLIAYIALDRHLP